MTPSEEHVEKQFAFDGEWIPDHDPTKIGENNFAQLDNLRYVDQGIGPIEGYTKITSSAINATYSYPSSGIQMRTAFSTDSYVVVQCWNSGETASRIYQNTTAIPSTGDFTATPIYTPDTDGQQARFGALPRGIGYCNEVESVIWEGDEAYAGAIILVDSISGLNPTNPRDYSKEMSNQYTVASETMVVPATALTILVGSTRPLQAIYWDIKTANGTNSTALVDEWSSNTWTAVGGLSDGTSTGGKSMAQDGWMTFNSTVGSAKPIFFESTYLYYYRVVISAGNFTVNRCLVDMPMQPCVDIWDGVYRTCIAFQALVNEVGPNDYTLEVNEESNLDYPITARLGQFRNHASDTIEMCFEERQTAIDFKVLAGKGNILASISTLKYWDGDSWVAVSGLYDGTLHSDGTKTMNHSGTMVWSPPDDGTERQHQRYGITGFWYQLTADSVWTGASAADVKVDFCQGVPVQRPIYGSKFPIRFQGRFFRGADIQSNEENALDFTAAATVDVHNGLDSSDRGQRIYVGGPEALTAANTIYNRFGSSIYETLLVFKQAETHLLWGTDPTDFKLYQISQSYGCPAPLTLASAEMGYEMAEGAYRNISMWLSYRGPVIFDGAVIIPIRGVDLYFDPRKTDTVCNFDYIQDSFAWYDPFWMEYNLVIPTGSSTKPNTHLVYDMLRKRWYRVVYDGGTSDIPQAVVVAKDTGGSVYPYVIRDDGHMLRYGFGSDWAGNDLEHVVKTADLFPSGSIWHETKILALKVAHEIPDFGLTTEGLTIDIDYYPNGTDNPTSLNSWQITLADEQEELPLQQEAATGDTDYVLLTEAGDWITYDSLLNTRYKRENQQINKVARTHQFKFSRTSTSSAYSGNFGKNFLWWGFLAEVEGYDLR
jgi:hypothetical protein